MEQPDVSRLHLEPLPAEHVRRPISSRLGLTELPDALARAVIERAEGNALFAEELVSYLRERGAPTVADGGVQYDPATTSSALPLSLQSLLAALVGRLSPERRAVLQAASAIGRRFDVDLLASATDSLLFLGRYCESHAAQECLSAMAARIGDAPAAAYALTSGMWLSSMFVPEAAETSEALAARAISAATEVDDPYLQYVLRFFIGWDQFERGQVAKATNTADDILAVGRRINDPRPIAWGMALKAIIAMEGGDYGRALEFAENGIIMARIRSDVLVNRLFKLLALAGLGRPESFAFSHQYRDECEANGWGSFLDVPQGPWGTGLIIHGNIGAGLGWLEASISRLQKNGMVGMANLLRMALAEVYVRMISRTDRAPLWVMVRNFPILLWVTLARRDAHKGAHQACLRLPHVDREGTVFGRCEMILGLLCKTEKRRAEAVSHLTGEKRPLGRLGPTPALDRGEQALRELQ